MALRLVFMGTPDFAVPTLLEIMKDHDVVAAYTRPSQPGGRRGLIPQPTPVALVADKYHIPIFAPETFRVADAAAAMRAHGAHVAVVVAYGSILPKPILDAFPLGCFNLHASLLPRWRGAAPINRAIMSGDIETAVMAMKMEEGLDTGPIATVMKKHGPELMAQRVLIGPDETAGELSDRLKFIGAEVMALTLAALEHGVLTLTPQSTVGVTYAEKVNKSEARIDWRKSCYEIHNQCRGLSPFPGAWFEIPKVGRIKVLRTAIGVGEGSPGQVIERKNLTIACGAGALRLIELQRAGGKAMSADAFWHDSRVSLISSLP